MQKLKPVGAISQAHSSGNYGGEPLVGWKDVYECKECGAIVANMEKHELWHKMPQQPKRLGPSYMVDKL
jgi:hypothetical protein